MKFKEFIRPEWKKFVIPAVMILFFLNTIFSFYQSEGVLDKYGCRITSSIQTLNLARAQNNTELFNSTRIIARELQYNLTSEGNTSLIRFEDSLWPAERLFILINPLTPFPCEFVFTSHCRHYTTEETYNCFSSLNLTGLYSAFSTEIKPYTPLDFWIILVSAIILLVEGYVFSAIILWAFRELKTMFKVTKDKKKR